MKKHAISLLLAGSLAGLLAACGGGGGDATSPPSVQVPLPTPTPTPTPSPPPVTETPLDQFFALVAGIVASMSDDTEPLALDDSAPTMPENTEPQAVTQ